LGDRTYGDSSDNPAALVSEGLFDATRPLSVQSPCLDALDLSPESLVLYLLVQTIFL